MADTQSTTGSGDAPPEGPVETELSCDMSLADITFIGVGAMVGVGVFALTEFAAGLAGPASTVAFILNGLVAMFTAVSYTELGAAFPEAGDGYFWVKEALADPNGFYAGWMSWFTHTAACALCAVTFGVFLTEFFVVFAGPPDGLVLFGLVDRLLVEKLLAVVMVLAVAYINYHGAEETGKAGVVATTIKILILGVFVAFSILTTVREPNWTATFFDSPSFAPNGLVGVIGAMGFTYIAFEGYEIIVQSDEEAVDPGTNVPKTVFYSMTIVVPIYVLVAFATTGGIDVTVELAGCAGLTTAAPTWQVLGNLGELGIIEAAGQSVLCGVPLLLFAELAATMSALSATIYSSSRVSFVMGRGRVLLGFFRCIHDDRRAPHWAIGLSAVLIGLMAVLLPIESVAAVTDIMFIFLFVQVNWIVVKMRATHPDLSRTYEIPCMPWLPLVGIVLQFILTSFLLPELGLTPGLGADSEGLVALVTTAVWMALGLVVYYGCSESRVAEKLEAETPIVVAERAPERRESQVLVPIANLENAAQLMRTAIDMARDRDAEILVMSATEVPSQTLVSEGRWFVDEKRETIAAVMELAIDAGVPVGGTVRLGHDARTAILNTIGEHDGDAVLMGWRDRGRRRDYILGSNVDEVVTKAPYDVLVERIGPMDGEVDSILLSTAGGPHAELAAEVCRAIAWTNDTTVHVVNVVAADAGERDREDAQRRVDSMAAALGDDELVTTSVREGDDVTATIIAATEAFDLVVIGATRGGLLQQLVFGVIPETADRDAASTVIMAKRGLGIISWVTRWSKRRRDDYHVSNSGGE